jgi:hypothetical protein
MRENKGGNTGNPRPCFLIRRVGLRDRDEDFLVFNHQRAIPYPRQSFFLGVGIHQNELINSTSPRRIRDRPIKGIYDAKSIA